MFDTKLKDEIKKLSEDAKQMARKAKEEENRADEAEYKMDKLVRKIEKFEEQEQKHADAIADLNSRHEEKIAIAVRENEIAFREKNQQLLEDNAKLKAENELYVKAFDNMGFDVKDMKEILNKLVDGLVAKNAINLIK